MKAFYEIERKRKKIFWFCCCFVVGFVRDSTTILFSYQWKYCFVAFMFALVWEIRVKSWVKQSKGKTPTGWRATSVRRRQAVAVMFNDNFTFDIGAVWMAKEIVIVPLGIGNESQHIAQWKTWRLGLLFLFYHLRIVICPGRQEKAKQKLSSWRGGRLAVLISSSPPATIKR